MVHPTDLLTNDESLDKSNLRHLQLRPFLGCAFEARGKDVVTSTEIEERSKTDVEVMEYICFKSCHWFTKMCWSG